MHGHTVRSVVVFLLLFFFLFFFSSFFWSFYPMIRGEILICFSPPTYHEGTTFLWVVGWCDGPG